MTYKLKSFISAGVLLLAMAFSLTSCYETHYYNRYHHHTHGWYDRHHTPPPPGVNWNVDVEVH